jgi:hypothetical protein
MILDPKVGDRIIERHKQSTAKTIVEVRPDYIVARGCNLRRISRKTLLRFNRIGAS